MNGDITHSEPEPPSLPRKITLERASDGYGFNLHGEKGIHGQFISAIDDGSPAQKNDLRVGDRVIGVNGEDVEDLPHSKVVERIRAGGDTVTLLVVDEQCDQFFKSHGLKIPQDKFETINKGPVVAAAAAAAAEPAQEEAKEELRDVSGDSEKESVENTVDGSTPETPKVEVTPASETDKQSDDGNEYEEVTPRVTTVASEVKPSETASVATAPEPSVASGEEIITSPVDNSPTATDTSAKLDMAAARPKPKRHEVKRTTQNWKQKYDDFNKL